MSYSAPIRIDGLQYCNWSEKIFRQMREGGVGAVHATICYHGNFREMVTNIEDWNRLFERHSDLILHGRSADEMVARLIEQIGVEHIGIGSDLCQDQPDSVVEWVRGGRWTRQVDSGEGSRSNAGFPPQPEWFRDNRDFPNVEQGLASVGCSETEIAAIIGGNWLGFFERSFGAPR